MSSTASTLPTSPDDASRAMVACVYYDGGCPLCRAEIATYRRAEGGDTLRWVDAHGCPATELGADLDRPAALARLHVRRADGTLLRGAAAFVEIWSALPRWAWLARAARLPGWLAAIVSTTDLIATLPQHIGQTLASFSAVKIHPCPVPVPGFTVKQHWHARYHHEPGNRWLRGVIASLFLGSVPPASRIRKG